MRAVGVGDALDPSAHDLLYIGGGQDREQAMIAPDLAGKADAIHAAHARGVAMLAVCGGYQLLGRGYRGRDGSFMPGAGLFAHETIAGAARMIGDVLLDCELDPGRKHQVAGFENHAGRTILDDGAAPLGRVVHGFGNDGSSGYEGCRLGRAIGTYLHGPLLPRNPWLADWLLGARARRTRWEASHTNSHHFPTSSSRRRFALLPEGLGAAAVAANCDLLVGHPIPPPTAIVTRQTVRMVNGTVTRSSGSVHYHGVHISPR